MATKAVYCSRNHLHPTISMRRRAWVLLLVASLVLGGCLSTRFIYNQIDWLMVWYISDVFSLEKEQKQELRKVVNRNLDWVRTQQFPEYAQLLRGLEASASEGTLSVEQLQGQAETMLGLFNKFLRQMIPDMASFVGALNDEQVADFVAKSEVKNDDLWEEYAGDTPEARQARRTKSAVKNIQRFTGKLDDQQQELIAGHMARMYDNSQEWMQGRRQWQVDFQALVLERPPSEELEQRLQQIILNPNYTDSDDYRQQVEANTVIVFEMLVELTATLNDKQRARMSERLLDFAEDFEALAQDEKLNKKMAEREAA